MSRSINRPLQSLLLVELFIAVASLPAVADSESDIGEWLDGISNNYSEEGWIEKPKFRPNGYMRPADGKGWQTRMLALQAVVKHGASSIPKLVQALKTGDDAQRIFAAQALGYLGKDAPLQPLVVAAQQDKSAAVRLYAVDSLGMRGNAANTVDWKSFRKRERDRDVLKHIGYAEERKNAAVDNAVVDRLKAWDAKSIDSAALNKPAPDFELFSANQEHVRLSSFRGKKAVVLVFIYGDT